MLSDFERSNTGGGATFRNRGIMLVKTRYRNDLGWKTFQTIHHAESIAKEEKKKPMGSKNNFFKT